MPKFPRNVSQDQTIRAFIRAGGVEIRGRGKGSHRAVQMLNGRVITLRSGRQPTGLLSAMVRQAGLTPEAFIELL